MPAVVPSGPALVRAAKVTAMARAVTAPASSPSSRSARSSFLTISPNAYAYRALALDEQRRTFEPTFWTQTAANEEVATCPRRGIDAVEQRWFVGAHANVGGGYPSDILAQAPLRWIMDKAAWHGLAFRSGFAMDPPDPKANIADSYATFGPRHLRMFTPRFHRPVGSPPTVGSSSTTWRINETIDGSVFARWRDNPEYRPPNLADWIGRYGVDPDQITGRPQGRGRDAGLVPTGTGTGMTNEAAASARKVNKIVP